MDINTTNITHDSADLNLTGLTPGTNYAGEINGEPFSFTTLALPIPPTTLTGTVDCETGDQGSIWNTISANLQADIPPSVDGFEFEVLQRIDGVDGPVLWRGSGLPNLIGDYIGLTVFKPTGDLIIRLRSVVGDVRGEYAAFVLPMAAVINPTELQVDGKLIATVVGPITKFQYQTGTNTNDGTPLYEDVPWPVDDLGDSRHAITIPRWGPYRIRAVWDNGAGLVVFGNPRIFNTALGTPNGLSIAEVEDTASGGIRVRCVQDLSNGVPQWSIAKLQFSQDGTNFGRVFDIAHNPEDIIERTSSLYPESPGYDFTWSDWNLHGDRIWLRIAYGFEVENNSYPHGQAQSNIVEHVWGSNPE